MELALVLAVVLTLTGQSSIFVSASFSPDGARIVTASMDGTCHVYSADGSLLHDLDGPAAEVEWLNWHPVGHVLAFGAGDGTFGGLPDARRGGFGVTVCDV